ncbi:hypothetical protein QUF54_10085, partial [Candidatus Marithioploca araucensis]|nr:hypothetical protein [Candidatus Marithioploca araucensis]
SKSKFSEQNFDDALFSSNDSPQSYVSKGDFDSLWEQVRKLYDTQDKQNIQAVEDLEKDFIRLFDKNLSKLSQSAVFKKAVQAEINASMAHLNTYFNEKLDEIVHNQLERHAKQYWDKLKKEYENKEIALNRRHSTIQRQHDTPVAKKESLTKPQLEVKQVEVKQKVRQPLAKKESSTKPQLEVKQVEVKQKVRQPHNNVVDKIKTILLSMKSVEEGALKTLDFSVKPCAFVIDVVANCLKLNQPATHYQRLANAIAKLTGGKVALIISSVGDEIRPEEHNVVGQKTVTKGKQNVVVSLIRPGVKCDNVIKRKAEIIQSVSSNG